MTTKVAALAVAFAAMTLPLGASFDSGEAVTSLALAQDKQTPRLSNGRLASHATTNIARDLPALAATLTEPMWIGYAQPLIDGDH